MVQERSVGVVVTTRKKPRKYLIIKYSSGHWEFPRGNAEKGESEQETAARECEEETGIADIDFADGFREAMRWFYRRGGKTIHKTAVYLLAVTEKRKVRLSGEHTDYAWLPFDDALKRTTFDNAKAVLKRADDALRKR